jgi:hypothetical protein
MVSKKDISNLMNKIVSSSTYVPSTADLDWTKSAIKNLRIWATPKSGCVVIFEHKKMIFHLAFNGSPTEIQLLNYSKIRSNLIMLGYNESRKYVIPDTTTAEDVIKKMGISKEAFERSTQMNSKKFAQLQDNWRKSQF